jgi:septal ring factor EnvC (AmiA/AmiB activator)
MAKALRVFVVLVLVCSCAALALGILLFNQREQLKGRTQKLEQSVLSVAQSLSAPKEPFIPAIAETLDPEQLKVYANKEKPADTMDVPLNKLRAIVNNRYEELFNTYSDLKSERDAHAATRAELAKTRQELADARQEIVSLKDELARKEAELAEARQRITDLEGQVASLEANIAELKTQLAASEEKRKDLEDEVTQLKLQLDMLGRGDGEVKVPPVHGEILLVNSEWNFVVLNIGMTDKLVPNVEMMVHRNDQLVGKVRVSSVMERCAVAEIQRGWEQLPIQEGDRVFN